MIRYIRLELTYIYKLAVIIKNIMGNINDFKLISAKSLKYFDLLAKLLELEKKANELSDIEKQEMLFYLQHVIILTIIVCCC